MITLQIPAHPTQYYVITGIWSSQQNNLPHWSQRPNNVNAHLGLGMYEASHLIWDTGPRGYTDSPVFHLESINSDSEYRWFKTSGDILLWFSLER